VHFASMGLPREKKKFLFWLYYAKNEKKKKSAWVKQWLSKKGILRHIYR
jgi:hypothetical protein